MNIQSIILADDDEDDRSVFEDVVKEINSKIKIITVPDGVQLMEMLQHFSPDILFLDLEMPYKNGLECLFEIRSNPVFKNLFIIIFTSTNRPANIQTAYEMGADLFLVKKNSFRQYCSSITSIFEFNWKDAEAIKKNHCIDNKYVAFG